MLAGISFFPGNPYITWHNSLIQATFLATLNPARSMRSCAVKHCSISHICLEASPKCLPFPSKWHQPQPVCSLCVASCRLWFPSCVPAHVLFSVLPTGGTDPSSGRSSPLPLRPDSRPGTPPLSQTPKHFHLPGMSWSAPCHCSPHLFLSIWLSHYTEFGKNKWCVVAW